ncbi:MAG: hypothetical protein NTV51_16990 [Verrucomicrobia bacterium]|nr:hypothetical protein [Verrucomicrobiota bacterium]
MDRFSFIEVTDLLANVGRGLGLANQTLKHQSTELSTLAVKTATVQVDLEMTSIQTDDELGFRLGAKTLSFGTATKEDTHRNTCSIKLEIVSVPTATPPAAPPPATTPPATLPRPKPGTKPPAVPPKATVPKPPKPAREPTAEFFRLVTTTLKAKAAEVRRLPAAQAKAVGENLQAAATALQQGNVREAKKQLNLLVRALPLLQLKPLP